MPPAPRCWLLPEPPAIWQLFEELAAPRLPWGYSGSWPALPLGHQFSSSRIQVRRICTEISGSLAIFSRRCLAKTSAFLVITGASLSLERIALGKLGFHLVLGLVRRGECRRGTVRAGRLQGRRTAHGGGVLPVPPFAAEQEGHNCQDQQTRQDAPADEQRLVIQRKGEYQPARCPRFIGSSRTWKSSRGLQQKSGFKGQGFNHQLVAAFRRESRDAGH